MLPENCWELLYSCGRSLLAAFGIFLLAILSTGNAHAEKRLALVIGIDHYDNLDSSKQLSNAVSDARLLGETLERVGFNVVTVENPGRLRINQAWTKFLNSVSPGDMVAFQFAGHGVEINGANYLIPRDVPKVGSAEEELLKSETISFGRLLDDLRSRGPSVSLIIVDACRNNPFSDSRGRSIGTSRGLARVEPPRGTFVMYSAGAGQLALDRLSPTDNNPNSVYTRSLAPLLGQKGKSLAEIARDVRTRVRDLTIEVHHEQTPAYYDELIGDVFLAGAPDETLAEKPAAPAPPSADPAKEAWAAVKESESEAELEAFVRRFGNNFYTDLARSRLGALGRKNFERLAMRKQEDERNAVEAQRRADEEGARQNASRGWTYRAATELGQGSIMKLEVAGGAVTVTYTEPSWVMANLAIQPGSVLFRGRRNGDAVDGDVTLYYGTRCGARSFPASGQFQDGGNALSLFADSVIIAMTDQTCDAFTSGAKSFVIQKSQ